ncbi:major facilitator superfamily-domain-containing protein [Protomyces lactucae-debilis]|uniref:Major facilitator superfamily-domain-containing protein n=1 Tax=Protomyces lactucae-debilis TaxID=2754530 RepID=A0A1Y2FAP0_PROLT|nr:major facilitator superfamily-domain-containing protein [Protomyces lactucae-debilis]ORY80978.1 major facilitator superfamily-domain-containing protein [Protomyces lactucae-debilis]
MVASTAVSEHTPLNSSYRSRPPLPDTLREVPRSSWILLSGLYIGVFLSALDSTMVATLATEISSGFGRQNESSWLGTSYLLTVAASQGLYGRFSDIVGRKAAALFSISCFALGTLGCAISSSMNMIIIARAVAGIGGAGLTTISSIIASDLVSLRQRGTLQGIANINFGLGASLGGPIGGFLSAKYGFRFAFLIQLPLCLMSFVIVILYCHIELPAGETTPMEKLKQIDFLGALTLVTATTLLVGAASVGGNILPWSSPYVLAALVSAIIVLGMFIYIEMYVAKSPVLPPSIVFRRTPGFAALTNFFGAAASFAFLYTAPIYFQVVLQASAQTTGLHFLPNALGIPFGSLLAGALLARNGRYYWLTLMFLICAPLSALSLASWGRHPPEWRTWFDIFFNGFGMAGATTTTLLAMLSNVGSQELAVATGLSYLARSNGQVLGVAVSAAILQGLLQTQLERRIPNHKLVEKIRRDASVVKHLKPKFREQAIESYKVAGQWTFVSIAAMGLLGVLSATMIHERPVEKGMVIDDEPIEDREG